jgi:hypothetical protein
VEEFDSLLLTNGRWNLKAWLRMLMRDITSLEPDAVQARGRAELNVDREEYSHNRHSC